MTLEINSPTILSAFGIGALVAYSAGFASTRRELHRAQEARLKEAVSFLQVHCELLEQLEDDDMPEELLALALDLSHLCLDPEYSAKFREMIKAGEFQKPERSQAEKRIDEDAYLAFASARPDLAKAFVGSLITGLVAFEKRWPDCAGVFGQELISLVTAPLEEARRVVDTAREMKLDWRGMIPSGGTPAFH